MMKALNVMFLLLLSCLSILAVPADGVARKVRQTDGSWLTLIQRGDEHLHFFVTIDDFVVCQGDDEGWYYALYNSEKLMSSAVLAHDTEERKSAEARYLKDRLALGYDAQVLTALGKQHHQLLTLHNGQRNVMRKKLLGEPTHYTGKKRGLVILVSFANQDFSISDPSIVYKRMFNKVDYSENDHVGSVHDYFLDQSYGQFDLTFDVVGPVSLSRNFGYYGSDALSGSNDINVCDMVVEACQMADEYVDYADYDWDGNGEVDQVFIVYADGQTIGGAA